MNRLKKFSRLLLLIFTILVLLGAGGVMYWNAQAYPASEIALQGLQSDSQVDVKEGSGLIIFQPVNTQPDTGFILYPGAGVDYRAYAPVLHQIAAHGYFVALVRVPLNLAFFDIDAATDVMGQFPEIAIWAVGGHSLGGVAASSYVAKNAESVEGLILWASYPADDSLATTSLKVLSVYGTNDMGGMEPFDTSRNQLPADTRFVVIEGGNHAQFGSYGFQDGDKVATISAEDQWAQIVEATVAFLKSLSE